MLKNKNILLIAALVAMGILVYIKRPQVQDFTKKIINNVYVSHLDSNDPKATTEFIALYKKSLIGLRLYDECKKDQMVKNVENLLKKKQLVVSIARNLMRRFIGYIAVDLKTGYCIGHEIRFTDGNISGKEFARVYSYLLQDIEVTCKKHGLKTLIVGVISPNTFYSDDIFLTEIKNVDSGVDLQKVQIEVLQKFGFAPMQGFSKFAQSVKDIFLGSYDYEAAWSKTL